MIDFIIWINFPRGQLFLKFSVSIRYLHAERLRYKGESLTFFEIIFKLNFIIIFIMVYGKKGDSVKETNNDKNMIRIP